MIDFVKEPTRKQWWKKKDLWIPKNEIDFVKEQTRRRFVEEQTRRRLCKNKQPKRFVDF